MCHRMFIGMKGLSQFLRESWYTSFRPKISETKYTENPKKISQNYSSVARDVSKNQAKKLSILLSFYFHQVLQYLNTFT